MSRLKLNRRCVIQKNERQREDEMIQPVTTATVNEARARRVEQAGLVRGDSRRRALVDLR